MNLTSIKHSGFPNSKFASFFSRDDEGGSDFDPSVEANGRQKNASAETARMFKLRGSLHQLASFQMQKENEVLRARST